MIALAIATRRHCPIQNMPNSLTENDATINKALAGNRN